MPPARKMTARSTLGSTTSDCELVAVPTIIPTKGGSPTTTPLGSPSRSKPVAIKAGQKQALIDNLQLEITERARKLRAQYALQAQGLRARIEIRVNRIPVSLRKANIGELLAKYEVQRTTHSLEDSKTAKGSKEIAAGALKLPLRVSRENMHHIRAEGQGDRSETRGLKRTSDDLEPDMDKENDVHMDLPNPKKRAKPTTKGTTSQRAPSRNKIQPSQVLSPKSSNSRTLPQSPIRPPGLPSKPTLAHPTSPLKPSIAGTLANGTLAGMVEKARLTRAASGKRARLAKPAGAPEMVTGSRAAQPPTRKEVVEKRVQSHGSDASDATAATVVTKAKGAKKATGKGKAVGISAAGKKLAPQKEELPVVAPRRVLRKRA